MTSCKDVRDYTHVSEITCGELVARHVIKAARMTIRSFVLHGFILSGSFMAACVTTPSSSDPSSTTQSGASDDDVINVCQGGRYHCYAKMHRHARERARTPAPSTQFYGPSDLASAYNFDPTLNPGATIAVVDAYGYPTLEADLAAYRSMYSLPACTSASGCLKIVGQDGGAAPTGLPPSDDDWTIETALDVDMASAACPNCKILVVEATSDQDDGLDIANDAAATLGATVISNSWGGEYESSDAAEETHFNHAGVAIFVAAGDQGNTAADYPSTSAYTIAVGGTTLTKSTSTTRGWTEAAWSDGGSSCNTAITQPSWQAAVVPTTACKGRAASDVAALGDPDTGVVIYDNSGISSSDGDDNGEIDGIGGTSLASPLTAGIFALVGHGNATAELPYANTAAFNDVTTGSNKKSCKTAICEAGTGWDGPTGIGTPNGSAIEAISGGTGTGSGSGSGSGSNEGSGSGSDQGSGSNEGSGSDQGSGSGDGSDGDGDNNGGNGSSGGGGCSTTGGNGALAMVFALGLAVSRRRRAA
jgi:uncharacterized protein (TIGR03382 family)